MRSGIIYFSKPGLFELLGSPEMASRGSENKDERGSAVFIRFLSAPCSDRGWDP